tara:strand:+ start:32 stop:253 length:222 start_codon:yes stop_codon:yes gene_type:complete
MVKFFSKEGYGFFFLMKIRDTDWWVNIYDPYEHGIRWVKLDKDNDLDEDSFKYESDIPPEVDTKLDNLIRATW